MDPFPPRSRSPRWFAPRRYGYGWQPITWQGWLITALLVFLPLAILLVTHASALGLLLFFVVLGLGLVLVSLVAGPPRSL